MTGAIDAHEGKDVAIVDIPRHFPNAENNEYILMCLRGKIAEIIVQVGSKIYRKYVTTTAKGEPILYVKLNKALYGLLKSTLLLYRKVRSELVPMIFVANRIPGTGTN